MKRLTALVFSFFAHSHSPILAVILLCAGLIVKQAHPSIRVFSVGILFALLWLAMASPLIRRAHSEAQQFFGRVAAIADRAASFPQIRERELCSMRSRRHLIFSLPLALAAGILPYLSGYREGLAATTWAALVLAAVFFYAGVGFWGLYVTVRIIRQLTTVELEINPFHSDRAGGLGRLQHFVATATWFYFSGGLLVPAAFELARGRGAILSQALLALYFVFGASGYFAGQWQVSRRISTERENKLEELASKLKKLYDSGGPTSEIERLLAYRSAVEGMKPAIFTVSHLSRAAGQELISGVPLLLTVLFPKAAWAAKLGKFSPLLKDLLS